MSDKLAFIHFVEGSPTYRIVKAECLYDPTRQSENRLIHLDLKALAYNENHPQQLSLLLFFEDSDQAVAAFAEIADKILDTEHRKSNK